MKNFRITISLLFLFSTTFLIPAYSPDLKSGLMVAALGSNATIRAMMIQADGKILGAGYCNIEGKNTFTVMRFNEDGSLDTSFGNEGIAMTQFGSGETASSAQAIAIQADGKIVVGGFTNAIKNIFRWCLARYNQDGSLDTSFFGGRGIYKGTVVTTFGSNDDAASEIRGIVLQSDGKIVAVGTTYSKVSNIKCAIARYLPNGVLDVSFNPDGTGSISGTRCFNFGSCPKQCDKVNAVAIDHYGKLIVAGSSCKSGTKTFALARLQTNGEFDKSFFGAGLATMPGTVVTSFAYGETDAEIRALVVQPDGKIVAGGYTNSNSHSGVTRFALARYDYQGRLDPSFGKSNLATIAGTVISSCGACEKSGHINALVLQDDGRLIAAGCSAVDQQEYLAVACYNADGSLDASFNNGQMPKGKILTDIQYSNGNELFGLAIQKDGSVVAAGKTSTNGIRQLVMSRYLISDSPTMGPRIQKPRDGDVIVDGSTIYVQGSCRNPGIVHVFVNDFYIKSVSTQSVSNQWKCMLPPMPSGIYTISAQQQYDSGKTILSCFCPVTIRIDQNPVAFDSTVYTCSLCPVSGMFDVKGASGEYVFSSIAATNGSVELQGNEYTFIPSIEQGQASFQFQAQDALTKAIASGTITVMVREPFSVPEVSHFVYQENALEGNLAQSASHISGPLHFYLIDAVGGSVDLQPDGSYQFYPDKGFSGNASFTYYVQDGNGCNGMPSKVAIRVYLLETSNQIIESEQEIIAGNLCSLVNGGVPPYTFIQIGAAKNEMATIHPDGNFSFYNLSGLESIGSFEYAVIDANNVMSNSAIVTLKFHKPIKIEPLILEFTQNGAYNDSLVKMVSGGFKPYSFEQVGSAQNGDVTLFEDGTFTFIPTTDFIGTAQFQFRITDMSKTLSSIGTVMLEIKVKNEIAENQLETNSENVNQSEIIDSTVTNELHEITVCDEYNLN